MTDDDFSDEMFSREGRRSQRLRFSRPVFLIAVIAVFVVAMLVYVASSLNRGSSEGTLFTLAPQGTLKENPENREGLSVPNQDVTLFRDQAVSDSPPSPTLETYVPPPVQEIAPSSDPNAPATSGTTVIEGQSNAGSDTIPALSPDSQQNAPAKDSASVQSDPESVDTAMQRGDHSATPSLNLAVPDGVWARHDNKNSLQDQASSAAKVDLVPMETKPTESNNAGGVHADGAVAVDSPKTEVSAKAKKNLDGNKSGSTLAQNSASNATKIVGHGSVRVQLASVPSEQAAEVERRRLLSRYGSVLAGQQLILVKVDLGARGIYHRVQTLPMDRIAGKILCETLRAKGSSCWLVSGKNNSE